MSGSFPITEHFARSARHSSVLSGLRAGGRARRSCSCTAGRSCRSPGAHQLPVFGGLGFRAIAPDMRGYGRSSVYPRHEDYALRRDRRRHDRADRYARRAKGGLGRPRLGRAGGLVASRSSIRTAATASPTSACPTSRKASPVQTIIPLADRKVYPEAEFPVGAVGLPALLRGELRSAPAPASRPTSGDGEGAVPRRQPGRRGQARAITAFVRANGGWFGPASRRPTCPRDERRDHRGGRARLRRRARSATASSARTAGT